MSKPSLKDFSHKTIAAIKVPGDYRDTFADVAGLLLRVKKSERSGVRKQWLYVYTLPLSNGKRESISLGTFPAVGIAEAREAVRKYAKGIRQGINPKTARDQERAEAALNVQRHTFRTVAQEYWEAHHKTWKNKKVRAQWIDSWMETYSFPSIGSLDVGDIRLADIETVLRPIWQDKHPTAQKITSAIGSVLEYAAAKGWRNQDLANPCKQRDRLNHLLSQVKHQKEHFPSLHYEDGPAFYSDLKSAMRKSNSTAAQLGLEFLMITGIRTNNVLTLEWSEIDWKRKVVHVPALKMKGKVGTAKDFSYPLIDRAMEILKLRQSLKGDSTYVFTGRSDKMSSGAMLELVKFLCGVKGVSTKLFEYKPKYVDRQSGRRITVHGFRSTLFSWAEDHGFKLEDIESVIAHVKGDQNLAAYARGNKLKIRHQIMNEYYEYLTAKRVAKEQQKKA
ncbi:MAG: tyrosine-type recombinase/integrase [Fluviibacter sp.]